MIKPIGLEEIEPCSAVEGAAAGKTVAALTDPVKRRLVWFIQWKSLQDGGLKRFAHELLRFPGGELGSPTMFRLGFDAETYFSGATFDTICEEIGEFPLERRSDLERKRESVVAQIRDWADSRATSYDCTIPDVDQEKAERLFQQDLQRDRELVRLSHLLDPEHRRQSAATFLYACRVRALKLPKLLYRLCTEPAADWNPPFVRDLSQALETALAAHSLAASTGSAATKIRDIVSDAIEFACASKGLVVINGAERIGKSAGAQMWCSANPDKARLVALTADTDRLLFYREIFDALGCGDPDDETGSSLRRGIRDTVQNGDLALVFDEAHCLFGLSAKASIKRIEYIRTEFVNRGIPVVLIITPQFANRLSDLEKTTSFNVNQLRGRVSRWVDLPAKPARRDIECLCRYCIPGLNEASVDLLASFATESDYPFAAVRTAATELRRLVDSGKHAAATEEAVKTAIGFALFTSSRLVATIPPPPKATKRRRTAQPVTPAPMSPSTPPARPEHPSGNTSAEPDFSSYRRTAAPAVAPEILRNRTQNPVLTA